MTINITVPKTTIEAQLKPRIAVIGVGGAGGNAVNNMIQSAMDGVDFIVANTDAQALSLSRTDRRIQLGHQTTQGLGAGARPEIGRTSAEEALEIISRELEGAHMAFITAGMGGGTGTGAAPVIARAAREHGVLTVGVVTKPFHFEGAHRMRLAEAGIEELAGYVDTLIVIPNQNLFRVANEKTTFADAFKMADDVLHAGVRSVTDLMMMPGLINLDFADVRTVMQAMGRAMMGTGEASGERRALDAAEAAIANPLLEDTSMRGAKGVLINITGGSDMTLFEVDEAANRIRDEVETDAHIIFGSCFDESIEGKLRVSVVATGIDSEAGVQPRPMPMREETRAVAAKYVPEIRTAARAPAPQPEVAAFTPAGSTLAPATGTMELAVEEQTLADMTAAARAAEAEMPVSVTIPDAEPTPAPIVAVAAPAPVVPPMVTIPVAPVAPPPVVSPPIAAQAAAVAEAMAMAKTVAAPTMRTAAPTLASREVFIPRAPMDPRMEMKAPSLPLGEPVAARPAPPAPPAAETRPEPAAPKPEGRLSLFSRYRSLTAKPKPEPVAEKAPEQPAKADRPSFAIAVNPTERAGIASHDEDELEIPAFLRRQAN
ncbi:MAG: cell division protein FtsZ [Rhodospirillaceae bacterium]|nr:MAG: cell division protein FtsZ [Rhodospirillaceae bacterium]